MQNKKIEILLMHLRNSKKAFKKSSQAKAFKYPRCHLQHSMLTIDHSSFQKGSY